MPVCSKCGKEIPDDSEFCPFCGAIVSINQNLQDSNPSASQISKSEDSDLIDVGDSFELTSKKRRNRIIIIISLALLFGLLIGLSIYQYYSYKSTLQSYSAELDSYSESLKEKNALISELNETNAALTEKNTKLQEEKKKAISEKTAAINEKNKALAESKRYETIKTWVKDYGKGFHSSTSYYAASNMVAVKVGETVSLDITYTGNRHVWKQSTNRNCTVEWSKNWSNHTTKVNIKGVTEGTTEIIFKLGDSEKSDSKESFRVLVIVVK